MSVWTIWFVGNKDSCVKVSSRIVLNMQNGGLGNNPKPAQATIKVLGRFLQSGDSAEPRIWN
jgi:hypothetical protein